MRSIVCLRLRGAFLGVSVLVMSGSLCAQLSDSLVSDTRHIARFDILSRDTLIVLPHRFILGGTERVVADSVLLSRDEAYSLEFRSGTIILHTGALPPSWGDSTVRHHVVVRYQTLPFAFQERYRLRVPVTRIDSLTHERLTVAAPTKAFSFDDLFGSNLQTNGSIVRGLSVGSNRDLSLNSGFRMQMSGNLTRDLQVIAALTDENTPIQPEGTTQTLQEVDKVFVELRGTNVGATLGDFNLSLSGNEFAGLNRKLQGGKGVVNFSAGELDGDAMVTAATARGKYTSNLFQGIDGVQGPYRLTGENNERTIVVIAGTERVYVDGERMTRGEINDYVIDYSTSEVTFTSRRLISSASRITVDFEYSDRQYNRNLLGARVGTRMLHDRVTLRTTFLREADDETSPIDAALSDSDKAVLQLAGGDRSKAVRAGAVYAGPGKGQYELRDTLLRSSSSDSLRISYYRYAPEDTLNAVYNVTFSFVGEGRGDYRKVTVTQYEFAGPGAGGYAPVRILPLPQAAALYDVDISARLTDGLQVSGEYALSDLDANRFSVLDDSARHGTALKFGLGYANEDLRVGGMRLGGFTASLLERYVGKRFVAPDRFNEIEFDRKWNIQDSSQSDEEMREGSVTYAPQRSLTLSGGIGTITRGDLFSSDRYTGGVRFHEPGLPAASYDVEVIHSSDAVARAAGEWVRHHGFAQDTLGAFSPTLRYQGEVLRSRSTPADSLRNESFRYNEIMPGLSIRAMSGMRVEAAFGWRLEDSLRTGSLQRAATTFTQDYHWQLQEWNAISSGLDVTVRDKTLTSGGANDRLQTALLRWQTHYAPAGRGVVSDLFYEAASERSAKLERVFQRVPAGTGNYVYAGDVNNNHQVDAEDYQLTRFDGDYIALTFPTDELIPVVDVKASVRLRLNGSALSSPSSWPARALSILSNETYVRVDEKSTEPRTREIYLLHFSKFLNDRTTLEGSSTFTDDLYLMENNPAFSCRFRFVQRKGLTQYALQNERTYTRERSVRVRWQLIKEFANQTDFTERRDNLISTQFTDRVRSVRSAGITTDWSYRPEREIELGFKFGVGRGTNFDTTEADLNNQSVRLVYAMTERGQARLEFSREEVTMNSAATTVPFELTNGRVTGKTWLWHASAEYRFTKVVQGALNYDGRSEGDRSAVHTVKAEVRAFF